MTIRYALARRKAVELLRNAKVRTAPVPVEELAARVGARIRFEPFAGEMSGMVRRVNSEEAIIGVNSMHAPTRRRFTIAHELGHLLLHGDEELHVDETFPLAFRSPVSSQAIDAREIEANQFGAELLMPESFLANDLKGRRIDSEDDEAVGALAQRYEVSIQAMSFRLSNLGVTAPSRRPK